jgi:hypothetical protein
MKTPITVMAILASVVAFGVSVATADEIPLKVTLQSGECHSVNNAINCTGTLTGLGSQTSFVTVTSGFECMNRGGNNPPGQVSGESGAIHPDKNGSATFDVTTNQASCPDQMTPIFTGTALCPGQAQIDVTQQFANRTKTTSFCVPIT